MAGERKISLPIQVNLKVSEETAIGPNRATIIRANQDKIDEIKQRLSTEIELGVIRRKKADTRNDQYKHTGLKADSFNEQIRRALEGVDDIRFETDIIHGALFERNTKSAFDFSFYDRMYNYSRLWNNCRTQRDFENKILEAIKEHDQESWQEFLETYQPVETEDCPVDDDEQTIVGEIQVGNWGLVYKDIMRLLRAKKSPGVNLYIYITCTGFLQKKLSDGIVNYKRALKEFTGIIDIIDIPILIIGVDIDNPDIQAMEALYHQVCDLEDAQSIEAEE